MVTQQDHCHYTIVITERSRHMTMMTKQCWWHYTMVTNIGLWNQTMVTKRRLCYSAMQANGDKTGYMALHNDDRVCSVTLVNGDKHECLQIESWSI
jgi:hypothetical protein